MFDPVWQWEIDVGAHREDHSEGEIDNSNQSSQKPTPHFDFLLSRNGSDRNLFCMNLSFAVVIMFSCLF